MLEVDDLVRAARLRHRQAVRKPVDTDDFLGAEQHCAPNAELANRPGAPDRDRVSRPDIALHRSLPASRKDVAQEQDLLVGEAPGNLDRAGIGKGHAHIFCLAARIAARQMRITEQARSCVAERLIGEALVAVRALADRKIAALALLTLAADDRERDNDAIARLKLPVVPANLDDF